MDDHSTDIFGPVEENSDDSVEEEPQDKQEKDEISSVFFEGAKLMYRSGKDTVKNILLFNFLIYLFLSRNSPNLLTDLLIALSHWCDLLTFSKSYYRAVIGGFRSDLSITRKTDGNFGNVSACVLFSKVGY